MEEHKGTEEVGQLVRLSQMEDIPEEEQPELLGWMVADADGKTFGRIADLLVDTETGEIPFASVCYGDKCTAIPLEVMFLDEANKLLVLPVDQEELRDAPEFTADTEDIQRYVEFWDELTSDWEEVEEEEE